MSPRPRARASSSLVITSALLVACGARTGLVVDTIAPPRPVAPLSTARVSNQRPTLAWTMPAGVTAMHVDLCADRACATIVTTFETAADHGRPSAPLAPGTWYWRLRARYGAVLDAPRGAVWQFRVPAVDSAVDTRWGQTLDLDLDGRSEWAVMQLASGVPASFDAQVEVFAGGPVSAAARPVFTLRDRCGQDLAYPSSAGDLDGDGFPELLVATAGVSGDCGVGGRLRVFAGGPSGVHAADAPTALLPRPEATLATDPSFDGVAAGDVDGDGYGDLVAGTADGAFLYRGGPSGVSATRYTRFDSLDGGVSDFPLGAGDVNGDGFADVVVWRRVTAGAATQTVLFWGSRAGLATSTDLTEMLSPYVRGGYVIPGGFGDVNGDGYADCVFSGDTGVDPFNAFVLVVWGAPGGTLQVTAQDVPQPAGWSQPLIGAVVADCDGNGFDDILVFQERGGSSPGNLNWFVPGGPDGPGALRAPWRPTDPVGLQGAFPGGHDIDGDGRADLVEETSLGPPPYAVANVYVSTVAGPPAAPTAIVLLPP